jgi:hypothetical protein
MGIGDGFEFGMLLKRIRVSQAICTKCLVSRILGHVPG